MLKLQVVLQVLHALLVAKLLLTTGYRQVNVLKFFNCPGPRQGVEDLRELLHKESMKYMMKNMFSLRWNYMELKGIVKLRFFRAIILKTRVPGQEGAKDNATERYREASNEDAFAVAVVEKIYAHESLTFNDTVACEVLYKWKAILKEYMDVRSDVCMLSNGCSVTP
nr:zinc finger, CCHC-type [Tanacetum cinerariifolium]